MLFVSPKQLEALAQLTTKQTESLVVEQIEPSFVLATVWGFDSKHRQYTIYPDGTAQEVKQIGC